MGVSKFVYGGQVKFDISDTTAKASDVAYGKKFYDNEGEAVTGTNTYDADTSDATAAATDILSGETAYVNGSKITGSMTNNGGAGIALDDMNGKTIPAGFHDGSGLADIDSTEKAKIIPGNIKKDVSILGVVGTYGGESIRAETKSVTPSVTAQTVLPSAGYDYLAQVNVAAIPYAETPNPQGGTTITIG